MKKTLIALAAVAATGVAFAQSSVTIYGKVNVSLEKSSLGGKSNIASLDDIHGSRLGVSVQSTHLDRPQAAHLDCYFAPM